MFKGFAADFESMLSKIAGRQITIDPVVVAKGAGVAAIGASLLEITKLAHDLGREFDDISDRIVIGTGASGAALKGLEEDFRVVFSTVAVGDSGAVAKALADINTRTDQTGEGLQRLTRQEVELARLTGGDLTTQIRATTRLFGDWSVTTDHQSEVLDKLFVASQKSGASVNELAQNVVQFGAPLRSLGIDLDTAISLFAKWEKEGVNVETVASTMRIAVARLAEAGLAPNEVFQDLLVTIRDMEDPLQATSLAMQVFGQRGGADMAAAIREGRFSVDEFVAAIQGAGGAVKKAGDDTDDGAQTIQVSMNKLKTAFAPVGTAAFQMSTDVIGAITNIAEKLTTEGPSIEERFRKIREQAQGGATPNLANLNPVTGTVAAGAAIGEIESAGIGAIGAFFARMGELLDQAGRDLAAQTPEAIIRPFAHDLEEGADEIADAFGDELADGLFEAAESAIRSGSVLSLKPFEDAFSRELERIDLEEKFGSEGAAAIQAFTHAVEGDSKSSEAIGRTGAKLIEALRKSTIPEAERLAADIASTLRESFAAPFDQNAGAAALAAQQAGGAALQQARDAEKAAQDQRQRDAENRRIAAEAKREADAAVREAERIAREMANVPIVGFMETLAQNRANFTEQFGDLGAGAAVALGEAFREGTASSGSSVAREVENIVLQLRREQVPNWRELGDDLAGAFHNALIAGTEDAKQAALSKLEEVAATLKASKALSPENFAAAFDAASLRAQFGSGGASVMDALTQTFEEGGERNREALARSAVAWIQEIRRGLPPEEASAAVDNLMSALAAAAEGRQDEARAALEGIFRNVTLRIPEASIDKAFDDAITRINDNAARALTEAQAAFDRAGELQRQRTAFGDFEQLQRLQLQLQQVRTDVDPNSLSRGLNTRAAEIRRLTEEADLALRRSREDADRALALLREEEDRQDARANQGPRGIRLDDLARMSQAERDASIRRLNEQNAADARREQAAQAALVKRQQREQQDFDTRRRREDEDFSRRLANELAIARLQDTQVQQRATFEAIIGINEQTLRLQSILDRATSERTNAERAHTEALTRLEQERTILDTIRSTADTSFDGMLQDITDIVEQSGTLAAVLGNLPSIGGGVALPSQGVATNQTTESKTFNIALHNNGNINNVDPEQVLDSMLQVALNSVAVS